ncbi:MAG: hypothetical protein CL607_00235 [Anaerolineaceae bacterium]|nr:hypothetical protein [Anaerolineaceae bacterium]
MQRYKKAFRNSLIAGAIWFIIALFFLEPEELNASQSVFSAACSNGIICSGGWFVLALIFLPKHSKKKTVSSSLHTQYTNTIPKSSVRYKKALRNSLIAGSIMFAIMYFGSMDLEKSGIIESAFDIAFGYGTLCSVGWFVLALIFLPNSLNKKIAHNKSTDTIYKPDTPTFDFDIQISDESFADIPHKKQTPTEFEHEVAGLIHHISGKRAEVVGGAGDGGIDIKVFSKKNRLVGVVQCKMYSPNRTVNPSAIRDLNTVRHYNHVNIAYLVTTGRFSNTSYELAKELGIQLIDGESLNHIRHRVKQHKPSTEHEQWIPSGKNEQPTSILNIRKVFPERYLKYRPWKDE